MKNRIKRDTSFWEQKQLKLVHSFFIICCFPWAFLNPPLCSRYMIHSWSAVSHLIVITVSIVWLIPRLSNKAYSTYVYYDISLYTCAYDQIRQWKRLPVITDNEIIAVYCNKHYLKFINGLFLEFSTWGFVTHGGPRVTEMRKETWNCGCRALVLRLLIASGNIQRFWPFLLALLGIFRQSIGCSGLPSSFG